MEPWPYGGFVIWKVEADAMLFFSRCPTPGSALNTIKEMEGLE